MARDGDFESQVQRRMGAEFVVRLSRYSYLVAIVLTVYGVASYDFLRLFDPTITLVGNLWPRFVFNGLPMAALGLFFHFKWKKTWSVDLAGYLWMLIFGLVFAIAGTIHVWPLALKGHPGVMFHLNAANNVLFAVTFSVLAIPLRMLPGMLSLFALLVASPVLLVVAAGGDAGMFRTFVNDLLFCLASAVGVGLFLNGVYRRKADLEFRLETRAAQFLGPVLSQAVFQEKAELLKTRVQRGFILSLDVRDSTRLMQKYRDKWEDFRADYFATVVEAVENSRGYIHKTIGDGHLISFGVMEDRFGERSTASLTPEFPAESQRLDYFFERAIECSERVFRAFREVSERHFPSETMKIGAGLDRGPLEIGLVGKEGVQMELDIGGDAINCATRLQDHSKALALEFAPDDFLLVISPFASDHISESVRTRHVFRKIDLDALKVRNYERISWVNVMASRPQGRQSVSPRV